jgi:type II secretion system protein N
MMVWPGKNLAAWKEPLLWIGGGLVTFVLCLGLTFPYSALQTRLIGELRRATGVDVQAAQWSIGFPLALEWRQITVSKPEWPPIQMGTVRAQVSVLKALTGGLMLDLAAQIAPHSPAQGTMTSTVTASSWAFTGPLEMSGKMKQVDLAKLAQPYISRGTLSGEFKHRLENLPTPSSSSFGEGTWKIEATDLLLDQIPMGYGRTFSLALNAVSIGLACREQLCTVTELKGEGLDGSLSGEGTITIQLPIRQSQLALSLTIVPGPGFAAKAGPLGIPPLPPGTPFTFKVRGTLAQARLAL